MARATRWETYADGRRPQKLSLIREILGLMDLSENEAMDLLCLTEANIRRDLCKLRIETLAVLLDSMIELDG